MKISFDLDGTICDSDWGWLDTIRRLNWPKGEEDKYYASRNKVLDPYRFIGDNDVAYVLTGRPIHVRAITEKWLIKNGMGDLILVFAMNIPGKSKGSNVEFGTQAIQKVKYLMSNNIRVHFDDNAEVVTVMRGLLPEGYSVIHTGNHIGW